MPRAVWSKYLERGCTAVAMVAVVWLFHWTVKSSGGFQSPGEEDYYSFLVRGWRAGHLYLSKEPVPELLALADPYDPAQNGPFRLGDASYYKGHYYLYFSAAPALVLLWPYACLTGHELGATTAVFIFCTLGFLAASGFWLAIRRRYFPESAWYFGPLVVLLLGASTHLLVLLRRPLVWELPLSAGFAFEMLSLVATYWALHGRRPGLALSLGGVTYGLAVASRPTCAFGALLFVPALWVLRQRLGGGARWWRCAIAPTIGIGACVIGLLAHNYARFEKPLEFGITYQLSSAYEAKETHFSPTYSAHNLGIYLFHPGHWSTKFPFVEASSKPGGPPGYLATWVEPICGLLVTFPFVWLAPLLPLAWRDRPASEAAPLRAMLVGLALFFVTVIAFYSMFYCATTRYMAEFTPPLMLLAGFAALGMERWAQSRGWGRAIVLLTLALGVVTLAAGLAVNFDYHHRSLSKLQPELWARMERFFGAAK